MKVNENNIGYVRHKFTPIKNKLLNKDSKTESKVVCIILIKKQV